MTGTFKLLIFFAVFLFSCSPVKPGLAGREQAEGNENAVQDKNIRSSTGIINVRDSAVPVYQDIYDMIRGKVAGVEVSGRSIKIRGTNSLNVSTEPLFVVDGVIVREIDDIAPETVRSIEVLKGPDASVYGARGSNGVIVITRKKGMD